MISGLAMVLAGSFTLWNTFRLGKDTIEYLKEYGTEDIKKTGTKTKTEFRCCPRYYYEDNDEEAI